MIFYDFKLLEKDLEKLKNYKDVWCPTEFRGVKGFNVRRKTIHRIYRGN